MSEHLIKFQDGNMNGTEITLSDLPPVYHAPVPVNPYEWPDNLSISEVEVYERTEWHDPSTEARIYSYKGTLIRGAW